MDAVAPLSEGDLPSLYELYRRVLAFPPPDAVERYWRWRFRENPFDDGTRTPCWVVRHDGAVVGALAQMPALFDVDGRAVRGYWAADFMVDPRFRGRGLGKTLFGHYRKTNAYAISIGYAPDSITARVMHGVGFAELPTIPYLFKFYSAAPLLERLRVPRALARPVRAVSRRVLARERRPRARPDGDLRLAPMAAFDAAFDALWGRVAARTPCVARRTSRSMTWRYVDNPFYRYHAVGAWRGADLCGCVVYKTSATAGFTYGTIPELIAAADDVAVREALLATALDAFVAARVDVVKTLMSPPHLERLLRDAGFVAVGKRSGVVFGDGFPTAGWYLTKGDGDNDFVPDFAVTAKATADVAQR